MQTDSSKCNVDIEKLTSRNIYTGRSAAISATFHHRLVSTQAIITYPQLSQSTTKSVQTLISGPIGTNTFGIVTSELVSSITTSDNSSQKNTQTLITGSRLVRSDSLNFNFWKIRTLYGFLKKPWVSSLRKFTNSFHNRIKKTFMW